MKKSALIFALIVGLLTSASTLQAQVNMSRYITLTVENGEPISLDFWAAANVTPIRIVSGSNTQDITVGTSWTGTASYTAGSTTMTVYGDLIGFDCSQNGANLTALDPSHNTQLTRLYCGGNTLSSLDVSNNTQLTILFCRDNKLNSLDISHNTQLKILSCYSNSLSSLDVSHNTQLKELSCYSDSLSSLDVSKNTQLTRLYCGRNTLSSLDVSKNTQLTQLDCYDNQLTSLDVSKNTQLTQLDCYDNQLTSLDVSKNTQLEILDCSSNPLSSLDVSKNTKLTTLYCHGNNLSTQALDDIYCSLPNRTGKDNGVIKPVFNSSDPNLATVLATNAANATSKNWKVQYYNDDTDIPATTGTYVCGSSSQPNMDSYITLTVAKDSAIRLDFKAAAAATPVRIVSGSNTQDITVGTSWTGFSSYTADGTKMTVYGDLRGFDCSKNGENLTALDASNNTQLMGLFCGNNNLSSLDVSKNTKLTVLSCFNNKLSRLDLSKNTQLRELFCYGNNFSTQALDAIYCALPDRTGKDNGLIEPVKNSSDPNHATVLATNAQNAIDKNWNVLYDEGGAYIHTTGSYDCSTAVAEATAEQALTLYPNPVADVLYLSATARTIRIYNVYGIEVAHATDTDRVEVSHLPAGIYTVKADGTVAKMVKR